MTAGLLEKIYAPLLVLACVAGAVVFTLEIAVLIAGLGLLVYAVLVGIRHTWYIAKFGSDVERSELKKEWLEAPRGVMIAVGALALLFAVFAVTERLLP